VTPPAGPLFDLQSRPELDAPAMIMCLDGWIDAGGAAASAAAVIVASPGTSTVAAFDTEELLDHRARRPIMHLVDGVNSSLTWPTITLHLAHDRRGTPLLVLVGPEPDHNWRHFTRAVVGLARDFGTRLVVGLGAYPAAAPHTRPPHLSATATSRDLAAQVGFVNATLEIPAGVQAAIERACADADLPAIGLWAQVPHYAAGMPYPAASAALLDGVRLVAGLEFDNRVLLDEAVATRARLDELIARNDEHAALVHQLEEQDDDIRRAGEQQLPSGDELAAEVERFLRDQHED
jgi:hypothetical protein